jgi:putative transcriptional regulator
MNIGKFSGFGKISRAKIELGEGDVHSHLLYMAPNGEVPKHTHQGFELTLLLEGDFHDDFDSYKPGDFIMLNGEHHHQPKSDNGCLCLTVVSDALQFTEGLSRLLNPVGRYIY